MCGVLRALVSMWRDTYHRALQLTTPIRRGVYALTDHVTQDTQMVMIAHPTTDRPAQAIVCPWHAEAGYSCNVSMRLGIFACDDCGAFGTCEEVTL